MLLKIASLPPKPHRPPTAHPPPMPPFTTGRGNARYKADPQFRGALTSCLEWTSRVTGTSPPAWDWGSRRTPDETPAQTSTADDQEAIPLPGPDETVTFEANIKPLFCEHGRQSMTFAFDLWARDSAWPPEKVQVFRRWTESGFQP